MTLKRALYVDPAQAELLSGLLATHLLQLGKQLRSEHTTGLWTSTKLNLLREIRAAEILQDDVRGLYD